MYAMTGTMGAPRDRRGELAVAIANAQRQRQGMLPPDDPDGRKEFVRNAVLRQMTGRQPQAQPVNLTTEDPAYLAPQPAGRGGDPFLDALMEAEAHAQGMNPPQADPSAGQPGGEGDDLDRAIARARQETFRQGGQGPSQEALIAERARRQAPAGQGGAAGRRADDPELDRILTALRNAHDAGDTESARRIARMAQERMGGAPEAAPSAPLYHPRAAELAAQGWANGAAANAPPPPEPNRLRAAVRSAGDAITFNHMDELTAAGGSLLPGRTYEGEIARVRDMDAADREAYPGTALAGGLAGAVAGPGLMVRGGMAAGRTAAGQLGRVAGIGAAQGGAYAFGAAEGGLGERAQSVPLGAAFGAAGGAAFAGAGAGFTRAAQALSRSPAGQAVAPTVDALRAGAQRLYERVEQSGATIPANHVNALARSVRSRLVGDGYNAKLHPRIAAVLDEIEGRSGPMTLREADILRRVATNAAQGSQAADERRLAMRAADAVDSMIDRLGDHSGPLREARAMWHTLRKSEAVEEAIERASTGASSFAKNLQTEFRNLIRNRKAMRGFSEAERKAIAQVVNGGAVENGLRFLGKTLSVEGLPGIITSGGALATGNVPAAAAMAGTGFVGRRAADAMTRRSANNALATVAGGGNRQAIVAAILEAQRRNALAAVSPGATAGSWAPEFNGQR